MSEIIKQVIVKKNLSKGTCCVVPTCKNSVYKCKNEGKKVSFHVFPTNTELRNQWLAKVKNKRISKWSRVCSDHFRPEDFNRFLVRGEYYYTGTLAKGSIPRLKLSKGDKEHTVSIEQSPKKIAQTYYSPLKEPCWKPAKTFKDMAVNTEPVDSFTDNCANNSNVKLSTVSKLRSDGLSIRELIALANVNRKLFDSLKSEIFLLEDKGQSTNTQSFLAPASERLLISLMKLKLGLNYEALAAMFQISSRTVSKYFRNGISSLFLILNTGIYCPNKSSIAHNIPLYFLPYKNYRMLKDSDSNRMTNTIIQNNTKNSQILIGISPSGLITVASGPWDTQNKEDQNLKDTSIFGLCEPYIDKGNLITRTCAESCIPIFGQNFLQEKGFTKFEEGNSDINSHQTNQNDVSTFVRVDRVIQRLKLFKILHEHIDSSIAPYVKEILVVCCALVNLSPPIHSSISF